MATTNDLFSVEGKVIIITGGGGFLGSQYAGHLSKEGAHVCLFDHKDRAELNAQLVSLRMLREDIDPYAESVDITREEDVKEAVRVVFEKFGKIDCLINNAGMNPAVGSNEADKMFVPYDEYPMDLFRKEFDVNLNGPMICSQAVSLIMKKQKSGVIINIASELALIAYDHRIYGEDSERFKSPAYIASKTAILGLTRAWAEFLGEHGIRVNAVSFGGVQTPNHPEDFVKSYSYNTMFRRMARENEYNGVIQFLCSDASSYMTGANMVVDGGRTSW